METPKRNKWTRNYAIGYYVKMKFDEKGYEDWFTQGLEGDYLRFYTLKTIRGLLDNVELLKRAYNQSVKDKLKFEK